MRSVIEMAREAGFTIEGNHPHHPQRIHGYDRDGEYTQELECFAELARADERNSWPAEMEAMERQVNILTDALAQEREKYKWDIHSCGPDCKRYACASMREAVAKEREACAKVCDARYMGDNNREDMEAKRCAAAIRARGNT